MGYDLKALKVLIVDDNLHMHQIMRVILGAMQIKGTRAAANATDGFDEVLKWGPDLIITDLEMDSIDGVAFIKLVRTRDDSPDPYVPIIVLSGHTDIVRVKEARDAGANAVLAKPVSIEGVYKRIVHLIERPRPFVKTGTYFGPDRRTRERPFEGEDRRENAAEQIDVDKRKSAA